MRAVVVAFLVLAAAAGCGSAKDQTAASAQTTTATERSTTASDRKAAPPLSGTSVDGSPIALADFRGRPTLVNVWSSW
jgi:cytochrome oxidase Cu insertion factor (SCO1/SenC/PrrC family)